LSLSNNFVTDISPLAGLTNLTCLNVAWNLITNYEPFLSGFSNLTNLDLGGNSISNVAFLQNLTQLVALGLEDNWISDLSPLVGLTNLDSLNLQNNLVTDIQALTNLAELSFVDVSFNLLDIGSDSSAMATIQTLQEEGVTVYYLPQVVLQPGIRLELTAGPTNVQLTVLGVPGLAYQIQTSTNLVDWAVLATVVSTNTMMFYDVGPAAGACFFRIQALNP